MAFAWLVQKHPEKTPKQIQGILSGKRKVRKRLHAQRNILLFREDFLRRRGEAAAAEKSRIDKDPKNWVAGE